MDPSRLLRQQPTQSHTPGTSLLGSEANSFLHEQAPPLAIPQSSLLMSTSYTSPGGYPQQFTTMYLQYGTGPAVAGWNSYCDSSTDKGNLLHPGQEFDESALDDATASAMNMDLLQAYLDTNGDSTELGHHFAGEDGLGYSRYLASFSSDAKDAEDVSGTWQGTSPVGMPLVPHHLMGQDDAFLDNSSPISPGVDFGDDLLRAEYLESGYTSWGSGSSAASWVDADSMHNNNTTQDQASAWDLAASPALGAAPRRDPVAAPRRCPHPACVSEVLFVRQCDLDKHYRQHFRKYFCRTPECSMSSEAYYKSNNSGKVGFSTVKDRDRHETTHSPSIPCHHCGKIFSRQDNLRDHCRKVHLVKGKKDKTKR